MTFSIVITRKFKRVNKSRLPQKSRFVYTLDNVKEILWRKNFGLRKAGRILWRRNRRQEETG